MSSYDSAVDSVNGPFQYSVVNPRRPGVLIKRGLSFLLAALILLAVSPVMLCIAFFLWMSGGKILFSHTRVGRNGKRFKCLKFRSMRVDAEQRLADLLASNPAARAEWQKDFKLKDDPRITRFGAFLRKSSLDELPQLLNVLSGDMCLVGPRPVVSEELPRYGRYARFYLAVRPGMTGLWQISGRNDTSYRRRVALDYAYVKNQSLTLDAKILVQTARVVFQRGCGAY